MRYNLRLARKLKKLSQEEMGKKLGISVNMVSRIENGSRNPSENLKKKICTLLEIEESEIS